MSSSPSCPREGRRLLAEVMDTGTGRGQKPCEASTSLEYMDAPEPLEDDHSDQGRCESEEDVKDDFDEVFEFVDVL